MFTGVWPRLALSIGWSLAVGAVTQLVLLGIALTTGASVSALISHALGAISATVFAAAFFLPAYLGIEVERVSEIKIQSTWRFLLYRSTRAVIDPTPCTAVIEDRVHPGQVEIMLNGLGSSAPALAKTTSQSAGSLAASDLADWFRVPVERRIGGEPWPAPDSRERFTSSRRALPERSRLSVRRFASGVEISGARRPAAIVSNIVGGVVLLGLFFAGAWLLDSQKAVPLRAASQQNPSSISRDGGSVIRGFGERSRSVLPRSGQRSSARQSR